MEESGAAPGYRVTARPNGLRKVDMVKPAACASRLLPLATALAAILGTVPPGTASAATLLVTDCTDGAASGTLRNTIAVAPDASTIQIPIACSTITLTQGAIVISGSITDMTITGQGPSATTIDASRRDSPGHYNRAFESHNLGKLSFEHLTIAHAKYTGTALPYGGCIYAKNDIQLLDAVVTDCQVTPLTGSHTALGGGIFSGGYVTLIGSVVSHSATGNAPNGTSFGGGIFAKTGLNATYSTIADNSASSHYNDSAGGGIYSVSGNVTFVRSTVSGNRADFYSAMEVAGSEANYLNVNSSTISGNTADRQNTVGAFMKVAFYDSTLAFNHVYSSSASLPAGLFSDHEIKAFNSIFANNDSQTGPANDVFSSAVPVPLFGANLLITATSNPAPGGTLSDCPRLGHLSDNGGATLTIPLLSGSPAIDTGPPSQVLTTDQRGTVYPRKVGSATDIGSFERQSGTIDDIVFFSGFDTRCN